MSRINQLKQMLASGKVDRRGFMQGAMALGVTISAASLIAADVQASEPKSGGFMRIGKGHGSTTDSLDPGTAENGFMTQTGYCYGNHLTEVDVNGDLIPELAEGYSSEDAITWRFDLRQGVEFHNGKTMTADDVIASLQHHMGDDTKSAAKGLLTQIKSLSADGNTVVIELDKANAGFPFIMSDYHLIIMPSMDGKIDATAGVGTGGYILENFEPGVRAKFKKNPNYFKAGAAHVDELELLSLLDTTARQNALMSGEVHAIDRVDPKTVALLGRVPSVDIVEVTGTLHYTFPMRVDQSPFDNHHLRMALKTGVKRQEMLDKILLGHGALGNDHPISTANQFHNGDLAQREYDPDMARHHLKKAGMEGSTVQLSSSDAAFGGAVDAAQLIKASVEAIGLNVEVIREPKDGYWSNVWNKKGWCACYWGGRPTEDWMYSSAYTNDTEWNDTAWKTGESADRFNALVIAARAELDNAKRREMYYETQELLHNDGGALIPMFANHIMGKSKKVGTGDAVAGNWEMDGNKAHERWWLV